MIKKLKKLTVLLSSFILSLPIVFSNYFGGYSSSSTLGDLLITIGNLLFYEVKIPALVASPGGQAPILLIILTFLVIFILFYVISKNKIPLFENDAKLAGWFAGALAAIVVFTTPFLFMIVALLDSIVKNGFTLAILGIVGFTIVGLIWLISLIFGTGRQGLAQGAKMWSEGTRTSAEANQSLAESKEINKDARELRDKVKSERRMLKKERNVLRQNQMAFSWNKNKKAITRWKADLKQLLELLPQTEFIKTSQGQAEARTYTGRLAAILTGCKKERSMLQKGRDGLSEISKFNDIDATTISEIESYIDKLQEEIDKLRTNDSSAVFDSANAILKPKIISFLWGAIKRLNRYLKKAEQIIHMKNSYATELANKVTDLEDLFNHHFEFLIEEAADALSSTPPNAQDATSKIGDALNALNDLEVKSQEIDIMYKDLEKISKKQIHLLSDTSRLVNKLNKNARKVINTP